MNDKEIRELQKIGAYSVLQELLITEVLNGNPKPTIEENALLDIYQDIGYDYLNTQLREAFRDTTGYVDTSTVSTQALALNDFLLSQRIPVALTVYRGQDELDRIPDVGSVFTMNAFTSTTLDRTIANDYGSNIITIKLPKGTRCFYMNNYVEGRLQAEEYELEQEVLIAANSTFKVTKKSVNKQGTTNIRLVLIEQRSLDGELLK